MSHENFSHVHGPSREPATTGESPPNVVPATSQSRRRFGGLLIRRECWTLSWKARLLLFTIALLTLALFITHAHSFLAVTKPANGEFLVVEGWIAPYAIRQSKAIFDSGQYKKLLACGGPVTDDFGAESHVTYGDWAATRLTRFGMPSGSIEIVRAPRPIKDRTYTSALKTKAWFDEHNIHPKAIDLVTSDAHGRRSRMLFTKAFGPDVKIGVISVPNPEFDASHWWRSSAGVREVLDESIAYVYASIFVRFSSKRID